MIYRPLIEDAARKYELDAQLLEAQVLVESSGHTDAFRFEPAFWDHYLKNTPRWKHEHPRRVSSSYGLLQIMFPVAEELGFTGPPERLFIPEVGLDYGAKYFRMLRDWAGGDVERALCAYNGGKGAALSRPYRTQAYANKVFAHLKEIAMNA